MVKLKQINGELIVINADLISYIKAHPNTVLTLTNGDRVVVEESIDEVMKRVVEYKQKIYQVHVVKDEE
ncbi:MAG: flagellar FlbD family protein [Candidatus Omnitrophica bacterium]|nr:flagellar FlbD family protein [Candidatus Omnitrophota bacterium]